MGDMEAFRELGIQPQLCNILAKKGILEPFEIQEAAIPVALSGYDLLARAPTGSGKTLAFSLPLIQTCGKAMPRKPLKLILSPTRELAEQINTVVKDFTKERGLWSYAIYGGVSYKKQNHALEKGVDILIATPGRLLDLMQSGQIHLSDIETVVLDEADRMADMGFLEPVRDIIDACENRRQVLLFSATLDDDVKVLVDLYMDEPVKVEVGPEEVSLDSMQHFFWFAKNSVKTSIACEIIRRTGRAVVFTRTRRDVERVAKEIEADGVGVVALHGGMTQRQRDRAMERFIHRECMALVATDVAARGIDVEGVNAVIHYDPPENAKAYKHRSGRTARGGESGVVFSLIKNQQKKHFNHIQRDVGIRSPFTNPELQLIPHFEVEFIGPMKHESYGRKGSNHRNKGNPRSKGKGPGSKKDTRSRRYRDQNWQHKKRGQRKPKGDDDNNGGVAKKGGKGNFKKPMTRDQKRNRPEHERQGRRGSRPASKRNKPAQNK